MIRSRRVSALLVFVAFVSLHSVPIRLAAQQPPDSDLDLLLNYGYLAAFFDPGIAGFETEDRTIRVLNVPFNFTVRDWEDRSWGLRLRFAGVLGVENVDGIGDIPDAKIGAFALIPGLEVPVPLSDRSLLRPFFDVGLAFATEDTEDLAPATVGISALGLRSEFVFPWRLFELGLEPRLLYSVTWSDEELRDDYGILALRADAQYPLFRIGDKLLTGVVYFQPAWFIDAFDVSSSDMPETSDVRQQYEVGFGWDWRGDAPKIWFLPVPPVGLGFSFGDGLEGIRIRIGGSRLTRLTPETWERSESH
ncbi:MAG: hypothetical protein M8860_02855 [marine benthic group bacterium]|nr:hypothetical protein [Candidatus Carthagonibacter metallireducens]